MAKLTIRLGTYGTKTTVSEMRRRLARTLSKLNGEQEVAGFTFSAVLEDYQPAPPRTLSKPAVLAAPYDLGEDGYDPIPARDGLWGYADMMRDFDPYTSFGIELGPAARPENE